MQGSFAVNLLQRCAEAIWTCWLTYDLHFVCGVDLPRSVGHMARVLPALLRRQVLQTQRPPLLPAFLSSRSFLLIQQRPVVLQPHDVGPRVAAGRALQPHRAAHRAGDDSLSHFWRLSETWTHWNGGQRERETAEVRSCFSKTCWEKWKSFQPLTGKRYRWLTMAGPLWVMHKSVWITSSPNYNRIM